MSRTQALLSEWTATFVLGMLAVGGGSVVALAAGSHPALGRWAPYLAFGLLLFGAGGVAISSRWRPPGMQPGRQPAVLAFATLVTVLGAHFVLAVGAQWLGDRIPTHWIIGPGALAVLLLCAGIGAWTLHRGFPLETGTPWGLAAVGLLATLFGMVAWASFADLRNVEEFVRGFRRAPFGQALATVVTAALALLALDARERGEHKGAAWAVLIIIPLLACTALAFRSDNLFLDRGERHWEFFVAAVRAVRNGEFLLWDAPSQYGFVNILLAAALPAANSWQGFYLLQSIMLALVAAAVFLTLLYLLPRNGAAWVVATGVALLLFFADPRLIGPQPYPSTSVVRFGPAYFMAAYFLLLSTQRQRWYERRTHVLGHVFWLSGVFWSAESAIYVTVIHAAGSFCWFACMRCDADPARWRRKLRGFCIDGAAGLALGLVLVLLFYAVKLGHPPDFAAFFVYGFSYAGGFGAMPVTGYGAFWSLAIPALLLVAHASVLHWRAPGHAGIIRAGVAAAALWAVLSYYVGRATPDNLTALLPLTAFLLVAVLADMPRATTPLLRVALLVFTANFIVLAFTSASLHTEAARLLGRYRAPVIDAAQRLPPIPPELQSLLVRAGVDARMPVVAHGYHWSMSPMQQGGKVVPFEATWLPAPLAMLEPIPLKNRETFLARYMARKRVEGYVAHERGEYDEGMPEWIRLLAPTHTCELVGETKHWQLYRFTPRVPLDPAAR